jgi:type IV secretion system protein TrbE
MYAAVLLGALAVCVVVVTALSRQGLAEHKQNAEGLADLLMYASVIDDGVLLLQDGALMATWRYRGPDLASATHEEMKNVSARLNSILRLGSGWMIHCDAIRSFSSDYPENGAFPDLVTRLIDVERRQQFTLEGSHFESEYFFTLTYLPPEQREEKLKGFLFEGGAVKRDVATRVLEYFEGRVAQFDDIFSSLFQAKRLRTFEERDEFATILRFNEQLRFVRRTITGDDYKFAEPEIPVDLQEILATEDFRPGVAPRYGKKFIRIVAIDGFPSKSIPGILSVLDTLPFEYRWNTRAQTLDPEEAKGLLEKTHKKWRGKVRGFWDQLWNKPEGVGTKDHFAARMAADAEAAMSVASEAAVHFALYTSNIVLMHEDEQSLDEMESEIRKVIFNAGFAARTEDINAVEAWRGSLPGDGYRNVRRVYLHTINLADCLPISAVWAGEKVNPSALMPPDSPALMVATSIGSTPFRVNLHVVDVGHALALGPTGAGKSTLLGLLAAQWFRYPKARVYCFDKGKSMYVLAKAAGGTFYDMGAENGGIQLCPLSDIDDASDVAWAVDYVESLCVLGGTRITPPHRNAINEAVRALRKSPTRSLTELVACVQDMDLRESLKHYTLAGAVGDLLDAEADTLRSGRFTVFEMETLMNSGDSGNKGLVAVLLYLFRQIEKRLDGSPTLVLLDEAWVYLKHPLFREKVKDWLKTMRRKNAAVVLATQSVSDVINSEIRDVVLESCPTKILLPNAEAGNENSRGFYTQLGLNERENQIVQTAIPKRQYYMVSPLGRRLISLGIGGVALSYVGVSSVEQRKAAEQMMDAYPETWQAEWLRNRAFQTSTPVLREWAGLLESELQKERSVTV